jgi:NADH:ubiquinone oxidoreductase subunit 5 (subunit L)/multisubunit Na+/H+ antiporter MnhA subunit
MKGAIIFLVVFALVVIATLAYTSIPPGKAIYQAALPNTEQYTSTYSIAGTNAFALIIAVFNGVIYAFIVWLIFTLVTMGKKKDQNQQNVIFNVNNNPSPPPSPQN